MSNEYDTQKPYMTYHCQGRYKALGEPWSVPGTGCAQTCDLRFLCWAQANNITFSSEEAAELPEMALAS